MFWINSYHSLKALPVFDWADQVLWQGEAGKFTDISEALNLYSCSEFGIELVQAFTLATGALDLSNWDDFKEDVLQAVSFRSKNKTFPS